MKLNKGYDNYQDYDDGLYDGDNGDDNKDHLYDNDLYGDWDVIVTILSIGDHGFDQTLNSGMNDESDRNMIVENYLLLSEIIPMLLCTKVKML